MSDEAEMPQEISEALRCQHQIDKAEAGQKAPVSGYTYRGVRLESRWAVLSELDDMKRIVNSLPELMARRLESIWCDSKAGATNTVTVRNGLWLTDLRMAIGEAVVKSCGGHNGVYIDGDAPTGTDIDPDWPDDYS